MVHMGLHRCLWELSDLGDVTILVTANPPHPADDGRPRTLRVAASIYERRSIGTHCVTLRGREKLRRDLRSNQRPKCSIGAGHRRPGQSWRPYWTATPTLVPQPLQQQLRRRVRTLVRHPAATRVAGQGGGAARDVHGHRGRLTLLVSILIRQASV